MPKFSRRQDPRLRSSNGVTVTDFVDLSQMKSAGPHSKGVAFLQRQVPSIRSLRDYSIRSMRWKKNRGKNDPQGSSHRRQKQVTRRISKVPFPPPPGRHMFFKWDEESQLYADSQFKIHPSVATENIADYRVYDTFKDGRQMAEHVMVFDMDGTFLFGKVARRLSFDLLGGREKLERLKTELDLTLKWKPDIIRGDERGAQHSAYPTHGYRKEPLGKMLGEYAFKPNTPPEMKARIRHALSSFTRDIELCGRAIDSGLAESRVMQMTQRVLDLPSFATMPSLTSAIPKKIKGPVEKKHRHFATSISIGCNYWPLSHTDQDVYNTAVTCVSGEVDDLEKVIHNFVFPEYNVRVPMRSGEVLLFNPKIQHCLSNPRGKDTYSASCYVPRKTIGTQAAKAYEKYCSSRTSVRR